MMKKTILPVFLCLSTALGVAQAQSQTSLKIDFGPTNQVVAAGYQAYSATDKSLATFTAKTYTAFGTTVTVKPTWAAGVVSGAVRMIDRAADDGITDGVDLLRDWIGTDTRSAPGDPLTLTISGLPAGTYQWVSYHHDAHDQTGIFSVTVNDGAGSKTTTGVDISNTTGSTVKTLADATKFTTTIVTDGRSDVSLVFHQTSSSATTSLAIFVMNGFDLTRLETVIALSPVPANGAPDVPRDGTILSWTPYDKAVAHDVYLGTTFDAVDDATTASKSYLGRQDANSYDPGRLQLDQTCYWRVDEVQADNKVNKGTVWSFKVEPPYLPLAGTRITPSATSSNGLNEVPEKTVDGSGLAANDQHGVDTMTMWLSAANDPNPTSIQYKFDAIYKLHQMLIWNHNSSLEKSVGFGVKTATVDYSIDGVTWTTLNPAAQITQATGLSTYAANTTLEFGDVAAKYVRLTIIDNWGSLKQYGLSEVRFLVIPEAARQPVPAAGATSVDPRLPLSWRAGRDVVKHQVYLGIDPNAVQNGTVLAGTVSATSYDASTSLELGRTYYWKVNEVNDLANPRVWEGEVWSFSTAAFLPVDDMESYNDDENAGTAIFQTWEDGFGTTTNGAQVGYTDPKNGTYGERTTVHGGTQSMPLQYGKSSAKYSEATCTFGTAKDWTLYGVKGLLLWFCGDPNNTAATMYVKINGVKLTYDGLADAILSKPWHLWYVDLSKLAGVNLKKITDLAIGFEGGKGTVFFDDLALTPAARQLVTPTPPAATGLVAHYLFDGNVTDATGAHPGTVVGAPTYTAGKVGQAIKFDGARDYVFSEGAFSLSSYTVALWFRVDGGTGGRDLFSFYDELVNHGILLEITATNTVRFLHRAPVSSTAAGTSIYSTTTHGDGTWYHVAAVKSATTMTLYLNGEPAASAAESTVFDKSLTRLMVGMLKHTATTDTRYLPGAVDDLYLYGRDLSQAEIASLAGRTQPFDKP
jgi:hypothetical protein